MHIRNKGLGLIEVLLVLAIAAVMIISAVGYYSEVSEGRKFAQAEQQYNQLYQGGIALNKMNSAQLPVSSLTPYCGQTSSNFCNTTACMLSCGLIQASALQNPWGQADNKVLFGGGDAASYPGYIGVQIHTPDADKCQKLLNRMYPTMDTTGQNYASGISCTSKNAYSAIVYYPLN